MAAIEREMVPHLRQNAILSKPVADAVAAGKVLCIEQSIALCHRLQQEVGSYALMAGTGFEHLGYLQCCKFAEGDSRVLMQKLARDRVKAHVKGGGGADEAKAETETESKLCAALVAGEGGWEGVYKLAEAVGERVLGARL